MHTALPLPHAAPSDICRREELDLLKRSRQSNHDTGLTEIQETALHHLRVAWLLLRAALPVSRSREKADSPRALLASATFLTGLAELLTSPYKALKCTEPSGSGLACPALPTCPWSRPP